MEEYNAFKNIYSTRNTPTTNQSIKRNLEMCELSPFKKMKICQEGNTSPSKETRSKKGFNFLTACQQVSTQEYYSVRERLGLINIPACCSFVLCRRHNGNQTPFQVLPYEREAFKIDLKSGMWCEALDVFRAIIKHNKYPSVEIFVDVLKMIVNIDDSNPDYSAHFIRKRCQNVTKLLYSVHPPCSETMRQFYKEFLNSPFNMMEKYTFYDKVYEPRQGIFKCIINCVQLEIDESLLSKKFYEKSSREINGDNVEYDGGADRVQRLFLLLELIVDLLERDLAIWLSKHFHDPRKHMVRKQKPLIAWMLWQTSVLQTGLINNNCRQYFNILISLIEYKYSNKHIAVLSRLINLVFQTFYLCGNSMNEFYPHIRNHCSILSNELFNMIKNKGIAFIMAVIGHVKPKQFQFLLSKSLLQTVLKKNESSFIILIQHIFKYHSWNTYRNDFIDNNPMDTLFLPNNSTVFKKLHLYGFKYFYKQMLKDVCFDTKTICRNISVNKKLNQSEFLYIVYNSFVNFLLTYNIVKIQTYFDNMCISDKGAENKMDADKNNVSHEEVDNNVISLLNQKSLPLNEECYKEYRLIFTTLKSISLNYLDIKQEYSHVYNLFQNIEVL